MTKKQKSREMLIQKKSDVLFWVKITPKSKKNEIIGWHNNYLKIRIHAPPEKNLANQELITFLSKILQIPKKDITIETGKTSPIKCIAIKDQTVESLTKKFETIAPLSN